MRLAIRHLAKSPNFTLTALVTLALCIGVNTTAFTALNELLLQSLPFRDPDHLVTIRGAEPRNPTMGISPGDYFDIRDSNTVFEEVGAYVPYAQDSLAEPGQPAVNLASIHSTANMFRIFGIEPQLGRTFTPDEEAHMDNVTLISNYFWRDHFAGDPKILGRTLRLSGKVYTIVGVLPARLDDPTLFNRRVSFWALDPTRMNLGMRNLTWYAVAARLKPGVTLSQARANLTAIGLRLAHDFPKTNTKRTFFPSPYPPNTVEGVGEQLTWTVMAISGCVLLIGCVNLANLQLVRVGGRAQEIAVRLALGSSRGAIVAMLVEESLILSLAGGLLGVLVAKWSNIYVAKYLDIDMPIDFRVLAFAFMVSALAGIGFGALPAWIASREKLGTALKSGGRGTTASRFRRWFSQGLVVVELTLALTILSGASYFVSGIYKLTHQELGWNADHVLFGGMVLDPFRYGGQNDPRSVAFIDHLREKITAIPGVQSMTASNDFPGFGGPPRGYRLDGEPPPEKGKEAMAEERDVGAGFFAMYHIPIVKGRDFTDKDRLGAPRVAIVNESMAKKCWPGQDPLGKRIGSTDPTNPDWAEVVGVVKDFRHFFDLTRMGDGMQFYESWPQNSNRFLDFNVETVSDPAALVDSVRKAVSEVVPDMAVDQVAPAKNLFINAMGFFTFLRRTLLELSALGLTLAAVGIYGVVATLVSERTQEIGIRMALGAQARNLLWLFLRNGLVLSLVGAALGGAAAVGVVRILSRMLPFLPAMSPWAAGPVALFLVLVAGVACWFPALRSTRVDPATALRAE
jgi:putative ABC transport system permease protein